MIFIDFLWRESSLSLVKYQLFDVDQLVNKSYHTQHKQWGPKSTNGKYKQVKPKDTRSTQYVKFTQVPNKKNANQLYCLQSECQLNLFNSCIFIFFTFCFVTKIFRSLSRLSSISLAWTPYSLHVLCEDRSSNSVYRSSRCKQWKNGSVVHTAIYSFPLTSVTWLFYKTPPQPTLTYTDIYLCWTANN